MHMGPLRFTPRKPRLLWKTHVERHLFFVKLFECTLETKSSTYMCFPHILFCKMARHIPLKSMDFFSIWETECAPQNKFPELLAEWKFTLIPLSHYFSSSHNVTKFVIAKSLTITVVLSSLVYYIWLKTILLTPFVAMSWIYVLTHFVLNDVFDLSVGPTLVNAHRWADNLFN